MQSQLPGSAHLLVSSTQIQESIQTLAREIDAFYQNSDLVVVGVLKGAVHFVSNLLRQMTLDPPVEWVRVVTYRHGTTAMKESQVIFAGDVDLKGKELLVADDILDQGHTYQALKQALERYHPASLKWAFLLEKEGARSRAGCLPDFVGLRVPDVWVVGYGLDLSERFRNLPGIYRL